MASTSSRRRGGARQTSFLPDGASSFYLVVPLSANREGSYGVDWAGIPRLPAPRGCLPQEFAGCP